MGKIKVKLKKKIEKEKKTDLEIIIIKEIMIRKNLLIIIRNIGIK
jgi:hypothetical protein